jgi:methyl-accepting chemotaxis protein
MNAFRTLLDHPPGGRRRTGPGQHRPGRGQRKQTRAALAAQEAARAAAEAARIAEATLAQVKARLDAVEAELKVRTDIMNVTSIVSEADKKGDILSVNEKFLEVSKYPKHELIGHGHNTTRHPDMPKEVFKQMWQTIGRGDIFRGVVKNRAKDGTPYYVDAVIAPILGENGKPMKYLGVRYDITEAELERQNARGILAAIDTSYAYIEFDLGGHVLTANRNFQQVLGYQLDEIKGKHHRMFVDPCRRWARRMPSSGRPERRQATERCLQAHHQGRAGDLDPGGVCAGQGRDGPGVQGGEDRHRRDRQRQRRQHAEAGGGTGADGDHRRQPRRSGPAHPAGRQDGPIRTLCDGVNQLMETTAVIFNDVGRVFGALSAGDLTQRITADYLGVFGQVKDDANATSERRCAPPPTP